MVLEPTGWPDGDANTQKPKSKKKKNKRRPLSEGQKRRLLDKTNWHCAYCKCSLTLETLTQDHIVPLSKGGKRSFKNVLPACEQCNTEKADKTLTNEEIQQAKRIPPKRKKKPMALITIYGIKAWEVAFVDQEQVYWREAGFSRMAENIIAKLGHKVKYEELDNEILNKLDLEFIEGQTLNEFEDELKLIKKELLKQTITKKEQELADLKAQLEQ